MPEFDRKELKVNLLRLVSFLDDYVRLEARQMKRHPWRWVETNSVIFFVMTTIAIWTWGSVIWPLHAIVGVILVIWRVLVVAAWAKERKRR